MEIPGGGDLLRTLLPPELLSGGSPCPVTPDLELGPWLGLGLELGLGLGLG